MLTVDYCKECHVPLPVTQGHEWLNNGDIVQKGNRQARMGFIETGSLDYIFDEIGKIMGLSIYPLVTNISSRYSRFYLDALIPEEVKEEALAGTTPLGELLDPLITMFQLFGYGRFEFGDYRLEGDYDDFAKCRAWNPFSVPEMTGFFAGGVSTLIGGEHDVTVTEMEPGVYDAISRKTEFLDVHKEWMPVHRYEHVDGDLEIERCGTCGGPLGLSGFRWNAPTGIIVGEVMDKRVALVGFDVTDIVFNALEEELGEEIPRAVVELMNKALKTTSFGVGELGNEELFRSELALRGLGNLRKVTVGSSKMELEIDNSVGHLLVIGVAQRLFEELFGVEARSEWELSGGKHLSVCVEPIG